MKASEKKEPAITPLSIAAGCILKTIWTVVPKLLLTILIVALCLIAILSQITKPRPIPVFLVFRIYLNRDRRSKRVSTIILHGVSQQILNAKQKKADYSTFFCFICIIFHNSHHKTSQFAP